MVFMILPRAVVIEGKHAVVAVLAVFRPRRPDDVARDAVAQLVADVFWDGVWQARRRSPWDNSCGKKGCENFAVAVVEGWLVGRRQRTRASCI